MQVKMVASRSVSVLVKKWGKCSGGRWWGYGEVMVVGVVVPVVVAAVVVTVAESWRW